MIILKIHLLCIFNIIIIYHNHVYCYHSQVGGRGQGRGGGDGEEEKGAMGRDREV